MLCQDSNTTAATNSTPSSNSTLVEAAAPPRYHCIPQTGCLADGSCTTGYAGRACGECQRGWYRVLNECTRCGGRGWSSLAFLVFPAAQAAFVAHEVSSRSLNGRNRRALATILTNMVQYFALLPEVFIGGVEQVWPRHSASVLIAAAVPMMDVRVVAVECMARTASLPFFSLWGVVMLGPFAVFALAALLILAGWLVGKLRPKPRQAGQVITSAGPVAIVIPPEGSPVSPRAARRMIKRGNVLRRSGDVGVVGTLTCAALLVIFFSFTYLALTALSPFRCYSPSLGSPERLLLRSPAEECGRGSSVWMFRLPFYVAGIILTICAGLCVSVVLAVGEDRHTVPIWRALQATLTDHLRFRSRRWILLELVWKALFVIGITFIPYAGPAPSVFRSAFCVFMLAVLLASKASVTPYFYSQHNTLDIAGAVAVLLMAVAGFIQVARGDRSDDVAAGASTAAGRLNRGERLAADIIFYCGGALMGLCVLFGVLFIAGEYFYEIRSRLARRGAAGSDGAAGSAPSSAGADGGGSAGALTSPTRRLAFAPSVLEAADNRRQSAVSSPPMPLVTHDSEDESSPYTTALGVEMIDAESLPGWGTGITESPEGPTPILPVAPLLMDPPKGAFAMGGSRSARSKAKRDAAKAGRFLKDTEAAQQDSGHQEATASPGSTLFALTARGSTAVRAEPTLAEEKVNDAEEEAAGAPGAGEPADAQRGHQEEAQAQAQVQETLISRVQLASPFKAHFPGAGAQAPRSSSPAPPPSHQQQQQQQPSSSSTPQRAHPTPPPPPPDPRAEDLDIKIAALEAEIVSKAHQNDFQSAFATANEVAVLKSQRFAILSKRGPT